MGSSTERPDIEALRELEEVLRHFESELAGWRRRALAAEQRLVDADSGGDAPVISGLDAGNSELEQRLQLARGRVGDLLDRLRFLEQQRGNGGLE